MLGDRDRRGGLPVANETGGSGQPALNARELGFRMAAKTGSGDIDTQVVITPDGRPHGQLPHAECRVVRDDERRRVEARAPALLADQVAVAGVVSASVPRSNGLSPWNIEFGIGSLGRNMGRTGNFASVDLRVTRAFRFGERIRIDLIAEHRPRLILLVNPHNPTGRVFTHDELSGIAALAERGWHLILDARGASAQADVLA